MAYTYQAPTTSPLYRHVVSPLCDIVCQYLLPASLHPNTITVTGLIFALAACVAVELQYWKVTALLWVGYSLCDNLDGKQARYRKLSSATGEYLDHVIDSITASLLPVLLVTVLLPACHRDSLFNPRETRVEFYARDAITYTPFITLLTLGQLPFYIGTWAHSKTGRLLLGGRTTENARDLFTVDEVNLIAVPSICFLRDWWDASATSSIFSFTSGHVPFLPGIDCMSATWEGKWSMTTASLMVGVFCVFCVGSSVRLFFKLLDFETWHFPLSLVAYVATVLFLPISPTVITPMFSWITSCIIFSKSLRSYEGVSAKVPTAAPLQIHKRWPLTMLIMMAVGIRCVAWYDIENARRLTMFFTGVSSTLFFIVARVDMAHLDACGRIRAQS